MKIAFNPSTVAALTTPPNNKDITFDLRGQNIFARGVKFCGTDTNTWRDIKINNVSIGSNILDLRNGSNTTLTNTNGVVTINSTWRPVVDNLTSNSTTSSLSANQGRILAGLINGKSDSDHNHDGRYVKRSGDTMLGALKFANGTWNLVGDDSYMGDCNVGGHFGIKAANTTYPGIAFFNNASTFLGNLTAYNGNIKYGAYSLQFLDNGNTSVRAGTWTNPFNNYNSNAVADGQAICVWGQSSYLSNLATDTGDMSLWLKRVNAKAATLNMVLDGEYYANGNQRLAHMSEIPTSLKNPYSLTTFGVVYDGSAAKVVSPSNFISQVSEGTSTVTDGTMFITSYASNSGFADTNAVNVPYKRKAIHLWEYIKAKTDSLYATNGHNHDDRYLKLTGGTMTGIIRATNRGGYWISGRDHCLIRSDDKTSSSYWSAILAIATVNGYWTLGHLGDGGERIGFNYDTDADYNAGRNNNHVIWLPTGGAEGTLALTSDIPTSLKNPYALTISLNGTSQGPYDGSAAKNINITPGSIGAATSGHNHDDRYLRLTGGTMSGNARIGHGSGNLYIGNSGNDNWVAVQDICSQSSIGDDIWSIRTNGTAHFQSIYFPSNRLIAQVSNGSNSPLKGIKLPNLQSNGIGIFSRVNDITDEGGIVLSEDTCVIYNSFDTGWGLSVRNKDLNQTDISGDNTIAFGVRQDYIAYSLGGFKKSGSDNSYVLLGGGGHKLESSLNVANADTVDGYHATSGRTFDGNINWSPNWNDVWSDGTNKHPWYGFDHRYPKTDAYSTTISDYFGMTIKTYNTLRLDFGKLLLNGININKINVASATKLQTPRNIWGQSFDGTRDVNGTIYINNSDSSNGAIRLNNNVNSNARISAIDDKVIFNTGSEIRFGGTSWDWDQWAGLKYTHSNKTIYLGIADKTIFNANSAQSGGTLNLRAGISNIDLNSGSSIRGLATNDSPYVSYINLYDTSISLTTQENISLKSLGPGTIKLTTGYGSSASISSDIKIDSSQGVYLNSGNSGNVYLCQGGGKVGIGTTSPTQKLDVSGNIRATGQIVRESHGISWFQGRNGALLRETSAAGYHALWSLKTTNGSWDFGEYSTSGWYNIPVLSYITDSNYNSGNNTTTYQIKFPLDNGTVALTKNIPTSLPANGGNADTVDGEHASSFVRAGTIEVGSPDLNALDTYSFIKSVYSQVAGHSPKGNTGWYNVIQLVHRNGRYDGPGYIGQIALGMTTNTNDMFFRGKRTDPWKTIIHSGNYTEFINNYYWANVKISTSSSTTTSPTVSNLTATNSIRMGNILLEHTDEINNSTNDSIHLNYRNSGNVSLCVGGGDVGIGTMTPSYKLDVNGGVKSSGFHHSSVNSDNYMLLAGGGYKSFGGDDSTPIFLGYLNLDHGNDGTVSSFFYCLGYSVSFTYTRGGNYCRISIPDTTRLTFYINAAIASVNYSGEGMDTWTGTHRGSGAWWLHCYASGWNEVRVKGFRQSNDHNDGWWGGNPLFSNNDGANRITVCIFGHVKYK